MKGDHLVGKYYVEFDKAYKAQIKALVEKGSTQEDAEKQAPIMRQASSCCASGNRTTPDTLELWKTMNSWVYEGFADTYKRMGVDFDKLYYESNTYLLGKEEVEKGLEKGIFFRKDDGSVWIDLTEEGLDQKAFIAFRWHFGVYDAGYRHRYFEVPRFSQHRRPDLYRRQRADASLRCVVRNTEETRL